MKISFDSLLITLSSFKNKILKSEDKDKIAVSIIVITTLLLTICLLNSLLQMKLLLFLYILAIVQIIILIRSLIVILKSKFCISGELKNIFTINKKDIIIFCSIVLILGYFTIQYPYTVVDIQNNIVKNNELSNNINYLSSQVLLDKFDNTSKVKSILEWQHNNMFNIYGWYQFNDNKIFPKSLPILPCTSLMFRFSPDIICFRTNNKIDSKWSLISKNGACGELSQAFCELCEYGNISYRTIYFVNIDHVFNEVWINDSWIIADPSISTNEEYIRGFNVDPRKYENEWKYNIIFAYAQYPNGTLEDVTYKYTNTSNITINTFDNLNSKINNVPISVQNNPVKYYTNADGACTLSLKPGTYDLYFKTDSFSLHKTIYVNDGSNEPITVYLNEKANDVENKGVNNTIIGDIVGDIFNYIIYVFMLMAFSLNMCLLIKINLTLNVINKMKIKDL